MSKLPEEQIVEFLKQVEDGVTVKDLCCKQARSRCAGRFSPRTSSACISAASSGRKSARAAQTARRSPGRAPAHASREPEPGLVDRFRQRCTWAGLRLKCLAIVDDFIKEERPLTSWPITGSGQYVTPPLIHIRGTNASCKSAPHQLVE